MGARRGGEQQRPISPQHKVRRDEQHKVKAAAKASNGCGGKALTVTFYDVGQGAAARVQLPNGVQLMIDTVRSTRG